MVRIEFAGRRSAGWVVAVDVEHDPTVDVRPLAKLSGAGPPAPVIELGRWAAQRWAGKLVHFLRAASPPKMVPLRRTATTLPPGGGALPTNEAQVSAFRAGQVTLVESLPADRGEALALEAAAKGPTLVVVPTIADRKHLASVLRTAGHDVAEYPEQWARSASGGVTIGTRLAAFAPLPDPAAIVVVDEHDTALKEERTPAWNARDVAIERARQSGSACVLVSPTPSLGALEVADRRLVPERSVQRRAWPHIDVVDMRKSETPGLLSEALVDVVRGEHPVACILNRKGRAQLLACAHCDALATCEVCAAGVQQPDDVLVCRSCGAERPVVCLACGGTKMKLLRPGISRVAQELEALARRPVVEVTADSDASDLSGGGLMLGTEALLRRVPAAHSVVFLDFDQELARPTFRAPEHALSLLGLAARRVESHGGTGKVLVQTRRPSDMVIQAALHGEPSRLARAQREVRQLLGQPPYGAWALVSGAGADAFVEQLGETSPSDADGIEIRSLRDRWRVSAPSHATLLAALNATERPAERVRVEVDPIDV